MADPETIPAENPEMNDDSRIEKIDVEVAYALPHEQVILEVTINLGGTVGDAITHSGILATYPEIDLAVNKVGVFGKITKMSAVLREGDRVEIYRPLIADPKEVRRQRAAEGKRMKKGGGDLKVDEAKPAKEASSTGSGEPDKPEKPDKPDKPAEAAAPLASEKPAADKYSGD